MSIYFVPHNEIDYVRWDECISSSYNGVIFAFSWYLDIACGTWNALIEEDYKSVMPIPVNPRFKYKIINQPFLAPVLGIFSKYPISAEKNNAFLKALPPAKYIDLCFNKFNYVPDKCSGSVYSAYAIDLIHNYKFLIEEYSKHVQIMLKAADKFGIFVGKGISPNELIEFISRSDNNFSDEKISVLRRLYSFALRNQMAEAFCAYSKYNGLEAVILFFKSHKTVHAVLFANGDNFDFRITYTRIIDEFLKINAENNLVLYFYPDKDEYLSDLLTYFGAKKINFPVLKKDKLPWWFKFFSLDG